MPMEEAKQVRLLLKSAERVSGGPARPNHLQRNGTPRVVLFAFVDRSHAAFANPAKDAVMPDTRRNIPGRLGPVLGLAERQGA